MNYQIIESEPRDGFLVKFEIEPEIAALVYMSYGEMQAFVDSANKALEEES